MVLDGLYETVKKEFLKKKPYKSLAGKIRYVRYADDFIIIVPEK